MINLGLFVKVVDNQIFTRERCVKEALLLKFRVKPIKDSGIFADD